MIDSLEIVDSSAIFISVSAHSDIQGLRDKQVSLIHACKELVIRGAPTILGMVVKNVIDISNLYFAGRMADADVITGVGLGVLCYN